MKILKATCLRSKFIASYIKKSASKLNFLIIRSTKNPKYYCKKVKTIYTTTNCTFMYHVAIDNIIYL